MSGVTAGALAACNSAASSSTAASGDAIYTAGTYTGTATGIGEVKVTMTFSETAITEVVIDASNETESIGGVAAPTLQEAIMAAQGTEIDNISGATVTTNAVKKAAASCIEQAMGVKADGADSSAAASENDWLGTEPEIDESKVTKTVDVDVAVVGCGVAGVAAVRSIAEDGGKVAAFEKADGPQCRSGEYAVINGNVQAKWGRNTWTREQIDEIVDSHMVESTYRCKRSIMSKWAHNIGDAFDWWVEANPDLYYAETTRSAIPDENANNFLIPIFYPLPENYDWKQERFPCYPTSVEFLPNQSVTVNANMQKAVDTGNVDTFYGCFVEKLIMEDGRCVGLYARDAATGEYIKCNAAKGVILSTGDYSQNTKMLQHFCPEVIENNIQCLFTNVDVEGSFTNQGDGIQLGMWAGAQVQQSHAPMIHHMGGGADLSGVGVMGNAGFLNLDLNGKRFMNEDLPGQQLENQIELQKNRESWQIFDSTGPSSCPTCPQPTAVPATTRTTPARQRAPRTIPPTATTRAPISWRLLWPTAAPSRPTRWKSWWQRSTPMTPLPSRPRWSPSSATTSWQRTATTRTSTSPHPACGRWRTAPSTPTSSPPPCCWSASAVWKATRTATPSMLTAT